MIPRFLKSRAALVVLGLSVVYVTSEDMNEDATKLKRPTTIYESTSADDYRLDSYPGNTFICSSTVFAETSLGKTTVCGWNDDRSADGSIDRIEVMEPVPGNVSVRRYSPENPEFAGLLKRLQHD